MYKDRTRCVKNNRGGPSEIETYMFRQLVPKRNQMVMSGACCLMTPHTTSPTSNGRIGTVANATNNRLTDID